MPRRDRSRSLYWGKGSRPEVSSKVGIPNKREGSDGDMQVRQTGFGARLFAKIGGKWLSNKLFGDDIESSDVYIPKVWTKDFVLTDPASTYPINPTNSPFGILPDFINFADIISFTANLYIDDNFMLAAGMHEYHHSSALTETKTQAVVNIDSDTREMDAVLVGETWLAGGCTLRVAIFYK